MSILVTGATGTVGSQVVERLNAKGLGVKALTRNENTPRLRGVHYVVGDLNKPKTLHPHLEHVEGLFILTQSEQTEEMFIANKEIINMAKSAGVRKI
ncbi:SDR family oxidoreductase [Shouchella patagoniensis]|uniref:SDR family oxidoreductase n=1 Tax=Shouchella patagoniensis TaxID=228576 RepID=UPI001FE264D5|nr:NmrA family NAD(P)-binding protein [Shouchella patagoniensis]